MPCLGGLLTSACYLYANTVLGALINEPLRGDAFLGLYGGFPAPPPPLLVQWVLRVSSFSIAIWAPHYLSRGNWRLAGDRLPPSPSGMRPTAGCCMLDQLLGTEYQKKLPRPLGC
jgi:hypothetical protein